MDTSNHHAYLDILQKCGIFQILLTTLVMVMRLASAMLMYFMAFGAYNPGWKCLDDMDNNTGNAFVPHPSDTTRSNITNTSSEYTIGSCEAYDACQNVEFNPEVSTIITEWGLVCSRSWIPALITSAMMAGLPVGTMVLGYCGDKFGRKWTLFTGIISVGVLHLVGMYSVAWQMFAAIRFFMGLTCAIVSYGSTVLAMEFNPSAYRPLIQSFPSWNMGMLVLCVCAMTTQNWKTIHLITGIIALVSLLPFIWVPESLRWLLTNGKKERSLAVVKKIAKFNKIDLPYENMIEVLNKPDTDTKEKESTNKYTVIDLFRKRFKYTSVITFSYFSIDLVYFATNLGVSVFPGNLYVNMIIMSASEIPASFIAAIVPNLAGRKVTVSVSHLIGCLCFTGVALVDLFTTGDVKVYSMLGLVGVGKICLNVAWFALSVQVTELYPTVLRSTAVGYTGFTAGIGSIIAPYFIPTSEDGLYVSNVAAGALLLICCLLELLLPETKGKPLPDTWEEEFEEFGS